jgi:hypothetical protein
MLFAVLHGNGSMAQFDHPEFAGSGQWMQGGMLMVGDMFNNTLKGRVGALCQDIAGILASQPGLLSGGSYQSQSQSGGGHQAQAAGALRGESSLFVPDPAAHWWPADLGSPTATGSQNNVRYAYFADARRLAVDSGGQVRVYDTLDHRIGGFSQQQGSGGSILFTSQHGTVELAALPLVSIDGRPPPASASASPATSAAAPSPSTSSPSTKEADIFAAIERLAELHGKGILTDDEYAQKKADLLSRL